MTDGGQNDRRRRGVDISVMLNLFQHLFCTKSVPLAGVLDISVMLNLFQHLICTNNGPLAGFEILNQVQNDRRRGVHKCHAEFISASLLHQKWPAGGGWT